MKIKIIIISYFIIFILIKISYSQNSGSFTGILDSLIQTKSVNEEIVITYKNLNCGSGITKVLIQKVDRNNFKLEFFPGDIYAKIDSSDNVSFTETFSHTSVIDTVITLDILKLVTRNCSIDRIQHYSPWTVNFNFESTELSTIWYRECLADFCNSFY